MMVYDKKLVRSEFRLSMGSRMIRGILFPVFPESMIWAIGVCPVATT